MGEKSKTFGLTPKKLANLLKIGSDIEDPDGRMSPEQEKAELLYDRLADLFPLDSVPQGAFSLIQDHLSGVLNLQHNEAVGEILQNSKSDIAVIRRIKGYYNKLSEHTDSKNECDVAVVIYYAAIACALVFHNEKISKFSYRRLERSFSSLISKSWVSTELVKLFTEAHQLCQNPSRRQKMVDSSKEKISEDSTI
jgi:hypothetical protein